MWPALSAMHPSDRPAPTRRSGPAVRASGQYSNDRSRRLLPASSARRASSPRWMRPEPATGHPETFVRQYSAGLHRLRDKLQSALLRAARVRLERDFGVISNLELSRIPSNSRAIHWPSNRLGVPPPIKMDPIVLSDNSFVWLDRSASKAST